MPKTQHAASREFSAARGSRASPPVPEPADGNRAHHSGDAAGSCPTAGRHRARPSSRASRSAIRSSSLSCSPRALAAIARPASNSPLSPCPCAPARDRADRGSAPRSRRACRRARERAAGGARQIVEQGFVGLHGHALPMQQCATTPFSDRLAHAAVRRTGILPERLRPTHRPSRPPLPRAACVRKDWATRQR